MPATFSALSCIIVALCNTVPMKKSLLIASAFLFVFAACKKAGLGGSATIVAFPKHHGKTIMGATGYVKFNTQNAPATLAEYDAIFTPEPGPAEDHVHMEGLNPGDYYIYLVGYDSSISQTVRGGIPFTISRSKRTSELDTEVPVTE